MDAPSELYDHPERSSILNALSGIKCLDSQLKESSIVFHRFFITFMVKQLSHSYQFGPFRLDIAERLFLKNGEPVPITPKAFEILAVLVENHGRLVEKDSLLKEVWPDSFVEESSLSQNIYMLRKVLGEDGTGTRYIETVPRHGYRFVAEVKEVIGEDEPMAPNEPAEDRFDSHAEIKQSYRPKIEPGAAVRIGDAASGARFKAARIVLAALLLGAAAITSFWLFRKSASSNPTVRSIAVLPFKLIGTQSGEDHLGLGMTDAMITKLSSLKKFTVRPTSSIVKYTDQPSDPSTVGRELGVDAVLEGTIQRSGDSVRVTVQLINVSDGRPLWADRFDEQFTNVFDLQDAITAQIAEAMRLELTVEERKQLAKRYTNSTEAYESYSRGIYFWNKRTEEGIKQSIAYFELATRHDPNYALAYAGLADAYGVVGVYGYENILKRDEAYQLSKATAVKALQLDNSLAEAHVALALVKFKYEMDSSGAEREYRIALALNPESALARHRYAVYLMETARINAAYVESKKACEIDPLSPVINMNFCTILYFRREYEEATHCSEKTREIDPSNSQVQLILGLCYGQLGRYEESIKELKTLRGQTKGKPHIEALRSLGYVYALSSRREEAKRTIVELDKLSEGDGEAIYSKALIYAGLGEMDQTFEILKERAPAWSEEPLGLRIDPRYDIIRSDPRYADLLRERFGASS